VLSYLAQGRAKILDLVTTKKTAGALKKDRTPGHGHLTVHFKSELPEVQFLFEQPNKRIGNAFGISVLVHIVFFLLVILIVNLIPEPIRVAMLPERLSDEIVWLAVPGPGGGGGGGGNESLELPREAELPGKEELSVPAIEPEEVALQEEEPQESDPEPVLELDIPVKTMAAGALIVPGMLEATSVSEALAQGSGTNGGAGTGEGIGIGSGEGSGLGQGFGEGTGGGFYRPGSGVELPKVLHKVKPNYTAGAMRNKVEGIVLLECIVLSNGSVGDVRIAKSLDPNFGLDQEAMKAARQWRFVPGTRLGEPVAVAVFFELTFSLR
jgi:protein TonB